MLLRGQAPLSHAQATLSLCGTSILPTHGTSQHDCTSARSWSQAGSGWSSCPSRALQGSARAEALGPASRHSFPGPEPALLWRLAMGIQSPGKPRPVILRWPVEQSHQNTVVPKGFELISLQRCHVWTDSVHRSYAAPSILHCPSLSVYWGEVNEYPA